MKSKIIISPKKAPNIDFEFFENNIYLTQGDDFILMDVEGFQQLVELVERAKRNLDL